MKVLIRMGDYQIEVGYGYHVEQRISARFLDLDFSYFNYVLSNIFSDPQVADYLINEVKVGEDVIVVDEDTGFTIAANIGIESIFIKTIYNLYEGTMRIRENQPVLRYGKRNGFRTEIFTRNKEKCYA